jgi:DNA replication protein DnaC
LEREPRRLDRFAAVILDDIGYVQQSREEMEVLFTFLAERYERRSVVITSNLVFSEWTRIFHDPLTTAAVTAYYRKSPNDIYKSRSTLGRCPRKSISTPR